MQVIGVCSLDGCCEVSRFIIIIIIIIIPISVHTSTTVPSLTGPIINVLASIPIVRNSIDCTETKVLPSAVSCYYYRQQY
jgi:hypothetical protein